jgi:16S rRNA (uracil1498-N3)-methyltransferase
VRIFVPPASLIAGELRVTGDEHHYLAHVRRARTGEAVELVDGAGRRAHAVIARIETDATTLLVDAPEACPEELPRIRVLVPLIKGERMDSCLEKLVEVGADEIVVWPARRSVVRLEGERRNARLARYHATAQAAARQCGRAHVPPVQLADSLTAALALLPPGLRAVLDPASDGPLPDGGSDVTIVSGPEGGLAPDELDQLLAAGFVGAGLGPRILRADTAPVIAVALIRARGDGV